jgi:hypothetical protein
MAIRPLVLMGALVGAPALIGCSNPTQMALATGSIGTATELMEGGGTLLQDPSGATRFRFGIRADAYDGVIPKEQHEPQRTQMLSQWLGNKGACPSGYRVESRYELDGVLMYEGRCT